MAAKIPVGKIVDIIGKGRDAASAVDGEVRIDVLVDPEVPRWVALAVKADLTPQQAGARVNVMALGEQGTVEDGTDAAVVLAGGSEGLLRAAAYAYLGSGVPTAVVAESSLDAPELELSDELARNYTLVAASEREALDEALSDWLIASTDRHVTMAANFAFCRAAECQRLINRCALENAAVGAVDLIHGADLPIMVGNQLKLLFDVAAANGKGLSAQRVPEAVAVVVAGFFYRAITRSMVGHTPVGKFAVRAAMGYAGTVATGEAIKVALGIADGTLELSAPKLPGWAADLLASLRPGHQDEASGVHDGSTQELPVIGGASRREDTDDDADEGFGYLTYQTDGTVL